MAIQVAIEGYDSLEQIGLGGMAAVYRARQVSIDKTVAIKILFPYLATDTSFIERFQREAKAAASIQHENIVNVIDFGESDGSFYIVMEYYDGRTLEQLIKERPGLPPEIGIQILHEVACGLEAAHALDIVHRDIKPANIIFTNQGGVKIADFGLARKSDSLSMITQHGKVMGTPAYMSPEQAAGRPVGPASDIFSFGVVAYELLGKRKPFDGRTYSEVLDKIQTCNPAPVSIANPLVAPEFERIVQRSLAKDERERYPSATALIADLDAAMDANQMTRDRRRLAGYARDPDQYDAAFADSTIASCLSRGAFFTQKGKTHMKDAVLEYKRVLFIDPDNERARANLARLGTESSNDTPARVAADRSETTDTATRLMPGAVPNSKASPRRGTSKRRLGALAVIGALGLSAIVWRIATLDRPVNGDNVPVAANESGPVRPSDASTLRADSLAPAGPTPGIQARDAMSASTSGAPEPLLTDSRDTPVRKPAADTSTKNRAERPAAGSDNTKPETKKTASVPTRRVSAPDTVAAPGLLSVFFLGGVGEVWIDGTLFPQQPPFERVSIPAGTHRIACRIGDDATLREMTVTIQPNRETVIEYEVGGKPIVVEE